MIKKWILTVTLSLLCGCAAGASNNSPEGDGEMSSMAGSIAMDGDALITVGTITDRGMIVDNVYHDEKQGDIHFSSWFPESYDGGEEYALFVTNPGWEGEYPQGLGNNLGEDFPFEARNYNDKMIILSTQLYDWGEKSARDSLALIHHFLSTYAIDEKRVYLHGYSGGGETGSIMMGIEPQLFAVVFLNSSRWDSDFDAIARAKTPLRLAVGENDSYYGSEPLKEAYAGIYSAYEKQGLSRDEINSLLVLDVKPHAWFTERGYSDEHAGGNAFAKDEETMNWLFEHTRD